MSEVINSDIDHHALVDTAVGAVSFLAISTTWMDWLDIFFKVLVGFLTALLLLQRIYAGCKRRSREKGKR